MNVSTKEADLLKDLQGQEKLCIEKYDTYAAQACSEELKTLFRSIADTEREHLQSVNELAAGRVPSVSGGGASGAAMPAAKKVNYATQDCKKKDTFLCSDMLAMEKHVSSVYDTSVFEFSDPAARQVLNHIQSEEQTHGLKLYEFMSANGMYGS